MMSTYDVKSARDLIAYAVDDRRFVALQQLSCLAEQAALVPDLLEACRAWMLVESEMADNHACPDLALRASYRRKAAALTRAAIAAAEKGSAE